MKLTCAADPSPRFFSLVQATIRQLATEVLEIGPMATGKLKQLEPNLATVIVIDIAVAAEDIAVATESDAKAVSKGCHPSYYLSPRYFIQGTELGN